MGEEDEVSIADVAKMICDAMEFKGFLTLNVGVGRGWEGSGASLPLQLLLPS